MMRYLSLTIGPVFDTLTTARSTKALWSASYLFSWVMREVLSQIRIIPGVTLLNLPLRDDLFHGKKGVGLFPDRFTARLEAGSILNLRELQKIAHRVVDLLADKITNDLNEITYQRANTEGKKVAPNPPCDGTEVRQFLRQYLRLLAIEFDLEDSDINPVKTADSYLNSLELQAAWVPKQEHDYFATFFEDLFFNSFIHDEFSDPGFPSTLEIATSSFVQHNQHEYEAAVGILRFADFDPDALEAQHKQEEFIRTVRNLASNRFRLCHKYIAIVRADGDHIGHLFKTLLEKDAQLPSVPNDQKTLAEKLANTLADFSLSAVKAIKKFGGAPVYAGGDDLLFFAPVSIEKKGCDNEWQRENIFNLLDTIDALFTEKVINTITDADTLATLGEKTPTMSYGLSISHHKYPLAESLDLAQHLLFKDIKAKNKRNGVGWRVTKHSGLGFGVVSRKSDITFGVFRQLLAEKLPKEENSGVFLASVMHKLESLEGLFSAAADHNNQAEHFENIIFNNFNESIHRIEIQGRKELIPFLKKVVGLLNACFNKGPRVSENETVEQKSKRIGSHLYEAYAALRFVHFLETGDKV